MCQGGKILIVDIQSRVAQRVIREQSGRDREPSQPALFYDHGRHINHKVPILGLEGICRVPHL